MVTGSKKQLVVVSGKAAIVEFDGTEAQMKVHRVSLPNVRQAVPLYIHGRHHRLHVNHNSP